MLRYRELDLKFSDIWRVFISGSSSAGKTHFARQILELKFFKCERIYYFHPDIQEEFPIDWDKYIDIPICYQSGIPSEKDLLDIPHYSCVILDDLFTEACADRTIDYLFRVLSSKRKLHVFIMTQRYFAEGSNGLNIRNSCNYHVLMNNADERTNIRVANIMNLKKPIQKALDVNSEKLYPYIFIDKTNQARVSGIQIYTDIFSRFKQIIFKSMLSYIISESDFRSNLKIIDTTTAVKNEDKKSKKKFSADITDSNKPNDTNESVSREPAPSGITSNRPSESEIAAEPKSTSIEPSAFRKRKLFERKIKQAIHRYKVRSKL